MSAVPKTPSPDFAAARFHMVESQIRPNKVTDERILDIMGALPREIFVPPEAIGIAYIDEDLQVAPGRYLLEPMILARMLQEASITSTDAILDVGPATGYSTAVLGSLAQNVTAVESDAALHKMATSNLSALNSNHVDVQHGAMIDGFPAKAPYDVIIINGSVDVVPPALTAQLKEGGRLLAIVRQFGTAHAAHTGEARLYEKTRDNVSYRVLFDANVKILPGFQAKPAFTF